MYNVYSHLVYAVTGSDVVTAIVNGRVLMEERAFTALDVDEVMAGVNGIAQGIA
jgi:cytosine/adenosine deaminase-related metal-dependent hydrolase